MTDRQRIYAQTEAEFAFARTLEQEGINSETFTAAWGLSLHQFNSLAHMVYGVADEEAFLPLPLKALVCAWRQASAALLAA